MDLVYLLDRLEDVLTSARRVPLSSQVMVDAQECLDVVDQLRLTLPDELKLARQVISERDQIIAEADARARQVVERAESHAAERLEQHAVVLEAEQRADALLDRAERQAQEIQRQADEYAYRVFASLSRRLGQIEAVVQQGLADLRPGHRPGFEE